MKRRARYVLVIDENVHHTELLTEILDRHFQPIHVHAVDNYTSALGLLASANYDLVLTETFASKGDLLDHIDGLKKSIGKASIVVLTGRGDETLAAKLSQKGVAEYLVKTKETLDTLPALLTRHIHSKGKSFGHKVDDIAPTKQQLLEELDKVAESALFVTGQCLRRVSLRQDQLEGLLESISRLKNMVGRL